MPQVAIIILNWNGADLLRRFLPALLAADSTPDVDIYVADNGSTDSSVALLRQEFPTVKLLLLEQNYGFAEGYNRVIQAIEAKYVVLMNSDVEVTPSWLSPLLEYMEAHPEVAACQPKIRSWRQKECFEYAGAAGGFLDRYGYPFCRGRIMSEVEKDNGQYEEVIPIFWATGAMLFIRRKEYLEAGGLDGRFFAHMEEIDLCWRLRARGKQLVCVPQSTVYHLGGATLQKESPRKTFLNFRNNLLMLYKNLPVGELHSVMRVRALLDYVAALKFLCTGSTPNARAVLQARREYHRLRPTFRAAREENMKQTTVSHIPERTPYSILWKYYIHRKKQFSKLK